jgi:hypothetical protein
MSDYLHSHLARSPKARCAGAKKLITPFTTSLAELPNESLWRHFSEIVKSDSRLSARKCGCKSKSESQKYC